MTSFRTYVTEVGNNLEGLLIAQHAINIAKNNIPKDLGSLSTQLYLQGINDVETIVQQAYEYVKACRVTSNALNGFKIKEEDIT